MNGTGGGRPPLVHYLQGRMTATATTGTTKVDTEPHVRFPAAKDPPEHVMKELRKIDPTVDLVYFGRGRWLLGAVSPNPYRQGIGERMHKATRMVSIGVDTERKRDRLKVAALAAQGMRFIQMYEYEPGAGGPDHRLVEDFRRRDRNWKVALEDHLEEHEKEMDGTRHREKAKSTLREAARAKASDIVSKVFRNAKQFLQSSDPLPQEGDQDGEG